MNITQANTVLAIALTALLAGCTTPTSSGAPDREPLSRTAVNASASMTSAVESAEVEAGESATKLSERDDVATDSRELFADPAFKRAFAESYLSETDIEPRLSTLEYERMQSVLELLATDAVDEAIAVLQKRSGPSATAAFDFTLGNLYFQTEAYAEALDAYGTAIAKHPKFRRAWKNVALIHFREEDYASAIKALTKVIELGGSDALTWRLLGVSYSSVEDEMAAESAYRMAVLFDPSSGDWKKRLAFSLFKQGRFDAASALFDSMLAAAPERADLWLLQASAFIGLGQPLKAAENYEMVQQLGEATFESSTTLADIYVNEGLYDLSVGAYLRGLELDPEAGPERAIAAAKALTANGARKATRELVAGIEELRGGILSVEQRTDVLRLRARIAVAEGDAAEEAALLEQVIELNPLDGDALLLLGQFHARAERGSRAAFYYEQAASIEGFEADAKVRHAQLLVGQKKYEDALRLLRQAQAAQPREHVQDYLEQVELIARNR